MPVLSSQRCLLEGVFLRAVMGTAFNLFGGYANDDEV
ncbi:MAG: hypothetical protein JWR17_4091 [Pseudomonas sp.]|jgi:hypothetical protein|nr:hypothetical protein [Pseudomonas sp.]